MLDLSVGLESVLLRAPVCMGTHRSTPVVDPDGCTSTSEVGVQSVHGFLESSCGVQPRQLHHFACDTFGYRREHDILMYVQPRLRVSQLPQCVVHVVRRLTHLLQLNRFIRPQAVPGTYDTRELYHEWRNLKVPGDEPSGCEPYSREIAFETRLVHVVGYLGVDDSAHFSSPARDCVPDLGAQVLHRVGFQLDSAEGVVIYDLSHFGERAQIGPSRQQASIQPFPSQGGVEVRELKEECFVMRG